MINIEFLREKKITWLLLILIVVVAVILLIYYFMTKKNLEIFSPRGNEVWQANKTYPIVWKSKKIGKIGIMLIKDKEPKESEWIIKDFPAGKGRYDWQIFVWQEPRQDYKIAIFEYPWKEGNKIDYSNFFTILGPKFASCDELSVNGEWPYVPNDFPNLRKVLITETTWSGNLGGLEGADQKCQAAAEKEGFEGTWKALLGDDTTLAIDRLNLDGIFVEARKAADLPEGKTCHRLLGKNFDEFLKKLSEPLFLLRSKFGEEFLKNISDVWLGRINKESERECVNIFSKYAFGEMVKNYSFTTTCQNWTIDLEILPGYPPEIGQVKEFPVCYTSTGQRINAVGLAGLSSGITGKEEEQIFHFSLGKPCNVPQRLLCIQQ